MLKQLDDLASKLEHRLAPLLKSDLLWILLMGAGLVLRLRQYAEHLSIGNDEAALGRNIVERSFSGLTRPLSFGQGAPLLFLFIQKGFVSVFGNQDLILEIFPLITGLVAIYFFYRIARRHFGLAGVFAVFAFAISLWLLKYSANPKQYSSDVAVVLVLVDLADRCLDELARGRDFLMLTVAGAVGLWLAHPAVFVLPGIGLVILLAELYRKDREALAWTLGMGGAWAAAFGLDYLISLRNLTTDAYLARYWLATFVPMPPWSNPGWFVNAYRALLLPAASKLDASVMASWSLLLGIGIVSLLVSRRSFGLIILLPFVLTLAASALHKYPIQDRLLLFLVPFVYLLTAEGLRRVYTWIARWNRVPAWAVYAVLCVILLRPMAVNAKRNFFNPPRPWDMRPVVEYITAKWNEGDMVYVSGGGETFQFYADSYGLVPARTRVDNAHRIARYSTYMGDMKTFAGQDRVWVVFARFEEQSYQNQRYVKYLNRVGEIKDSFDTGSARVYLCTFDP